MKLLIIKIKLMAILLFVSLLVSCAEAERSKVSHLEKGIVYLDNNNIDKARIEFKNALQIDPKYSRAYYYMGMLEERNKNLRKALSYYNGAMELSPKDLEPKIKVAKIYLVVGTKEYIKKSKEMLTEIIALDPDNIEANLILSTIDYKEGRQEKAISDIETLLVKNDDSVEIISLLSTMYSSRGENIKAMSLLSKGVQRQPDNVSLRMSYAKLLSNNNNYKETEAQLLKIIELKPESFSFYLSLSNFYKTHKQIRKAEEVIRRSIEANKDDVNRYYSLIEFLKDQKSVNDAEMELIGLISDKPDLYGLQFALSDMYVDTNRLDKAISQLKRIIANRSYQKEGVKARLKLSSLLLKEGEIDNADKLVLEVLSEYPNSSEALLIKSKIALNNNDVLVAINGLRAILKNQPASIDVSLMLSKAHILNSDNDLAENVLKNSIDFNQSDPEVYCNYIKFLMEYARYKESFIVLDRALTLFPDDYDLMELNILLVTQISDKSEYNDLLSVLQKKYPINSDLYIKRGKRFLRMRKYNNALKEFESAYELSVNKYRALELIVHTHIMRNSSAEAVSRLQSMLSDKNNKSVAYRLLGLIYTKENDFDKAILNYKQAIKDSKTWVIPYMDLSSLFLKNNMIDQAIEVYRDAIKFVSGVENIKMKLALLYEKKKNYRSAVALYDEILAVNPTNLMVKNNLVLLLIKEADNKPALNRARVLIDEFKTMQQPRFKDTYGWVSFNLGETEKAAKVLGEVVESSPDVADFKYHFAVVLNQLGDFKKAKYYLSQILQSEKEFSNRVQAEALYKKL